MNYGTIKPVDIADGVGCRVGFYVSGCTRHCPGCHNPEAQNFDYGKPYTHDTQVEILNLLNPKHISGLSVLGGEPLEPKNYYPLYGLLSDAKKYFPDKTIWLWTGFTYEEVKDNFLMEFVDVLVDGAYIQEQRDISLRFRGSQNQRIIDVKKSREAGCVVLWEDWQEKEGLRKCGNSG